MHLNKIHLKNYKKHTDLHATFSPDGNLLSGENELGKSTLVEAIHRVLFLKGKLSGKLLEAMYTIGSKEAPEICLWFTHNTKQYELYKKFGRSGKAVASLKENERLIAENDQVDEHMQTILGVPTQSTQKNLDDSWKHLWVWQGHSGNDLDDTLSHSNEDLLKKLDGQGDESFNVQEIDTKLFNLFSTELNNYFTKSGKIKSSSNLNLLENEMRILQEKKINLVSTTERIEENVRKHTDATNKLSLNKIDIKTKRESITNYAIKLEEAEKIAVAITPLEQNITNLSQQENRLSKDLEKIKKYQEEIETSQDFIKKMEKPEDNENKLKELQIELQKTSEDEEKNNLQIEAIRSNVAFSKKEIKFHELQMRVNNGLNRIKTITSLEEKVQQIIEENSKLPTITLEEYKELVNLEKNVNDLKNKAEALQATIQIKHTQKAVLVNNKELKVDQQTTLDNETTIQYGNELELVVKAPSSKDANYTKELFIKARNKFKQRLEQIIIDGKPITSLEGIIDGIAKRKQNVEKLKEVKAELAGLDPTKSKELILKLQNELVAKKQEYKNTKPPHWKNISTLDEANELKSTLDQEERVLEQKQTTFRTKGKSLQQQINTIAQKLQETQKEYDSKITELKLNQKLLKTTLEDYGGSEINLQKEYEKIKETITIDTQKLNNIKNNEAYNNLELLKSRLSREQSGLESLTKKEQTLIQTINECNGAIKAQNPSQDPYAELHQITENIELVSEKIRLEKIEADAYQLLTNLFEENIATAGDKLSGKLEKHINSYIKVLFGKNAKVYLDYSNNKLSNFRLFRKETNSSEIPFAKLSGGTKEQLATAVRLATAEILAQDFNNKLPIIFDDAFSFSDKQRTDSLKDMLELAVKNGLQIILSTCRESDYIGIFDTDPIELN